MYHNLFVYQPFGNKNLCTWILESYPDIVRSFFLQIQMKDGGVLDFIQLHTYKVVRKDSSDNLVHNLKLLKFSYNLSHANSY